MDTKQRRNIVILVFVIIALVALSVFLNLSRTGTLKISAPAKTPNNKAVTVKIFRDENEEKSLAIKPGETKDVRLGKGTVRVDGSVGGLKAVDVVTIEGFGTTKLTTPTGEQRAVQQLGSDAKYCPFVVGTVTYSYTCDGEGPIFRHDKNSVGGSTNSVLFDGQTFSYLKPTKGGLLGFYAVAGNAPDLLYIDLSNPAVQIVKLPKAAAETMQSSQPEIVVPDDTANDPRFALVFTQKDKIYSFKDTSDSNPVQIHAGKGIKLNDSGRIIKGSLSGDRFVLYVGVATDSGEGGATDNAKTTKAISELPSYLFEYTSTGTLTRTLSLPSDIGANGVYRLNDRYYVSSQPNGFGFYYRQDDTLIHVYTINDMSSWTISNGSAYIVAGGTIYRFKPGNDKAFSLHSLYASSDITVSGLYTGPEGILFTGLADNSSDAPLNIYQLLNAREKGTSATSGQASQQEAPSVTEPSFIGFDVFLDYGLTSFQETNVRLAVEKYIASINTPIRTATVTNATPEPHDSLSTSTTDSIDFKLTLNSKTTLSAKLEYSDLYNVRLFLNDTSGVQVFDSQIIDYREPSTYNPEQPH
jgi:hypothetical protein